MQIVTDRCIVQRPIFISTRTSFINTRFNLIFSLYQTQKTNMMKQNGINKNRNNIFCYCIRHITMHTFVTNWYTGYTQLSGIYHINIQIEPLT